MKFEANFVLVPPSIPPPDKNFPSPPCRVKSCSPPLAESRHSPPCRPTPRPRMITALLLASLYSLRSNLGAECTVLLLFVLGIVKCSKYNFGR